MKRAGGGAGGAAPFRRLNPIEAATVRRADARRVCIPASLAAALLAACSSGNEDQRRDASLGVPSSPRATQGSAIPKGGGAYKVGNPYQVGGRWYVPRVDPQYDRTGIASWYGSDFHGRRTANGEIFDMNALSAAHTTMPIPSFAYVTNLENGRTLLVRVNDRGPYVADRIIDLSRASATALGCVNAGLCRVRVKYAGQAPLDGSDHHERQHLARQSWAGAARYAAAEDAPRAAARSPQRGGWSPFAHRSGLGGP